MAIVCVVAPVIILKRDVKPQKAKKFKNIAECKTKCIYDAHTSTLTSLEGKGTKTETVLDYNKNTNEIIKRFDDESKEKDKLIQEKDLETYSYNYREKHKKYKEEQCRKKAHLITYIVLGTIILGLIILIIILATKK